MENPSWRVKLARHNINILQVGPDYWVIEFTYHPKPGVFKWLKTITSAPPLPASPDDYAKAVLADVLSLRKELEPSANAQ